jgi:sec-independent protein translocase protein TatA
MNLSVRMRNLDWTTIVAVGVLIVVLIWGPQKIPDLARSLGRARREFDQASKGLSEPNTNISAETPTQEPLVDVAKRLGINTQGKTRQEISDEIVKSASVHS